MSENSTCDPEDVLKGDTCERLFLWDGLDCASKHQVQRFRLPVVDPRARAADSDHERDDGTNGLSLRTVLPQQTVCHAFMMPLQHP